MDQKTFRGNLFYVFGILVVIGVILVVISYLGEFGAGFIPPVDDDFSQFYVDSPDFLLEEGIDYRARVETNLGEFELDLYEQAAPLAVNNFIYLSRLGYYNGVDFHLLQPNFLAQTGSGLSKNSDPSDDILGTAGYTFNDQINWDSLGITEAKKTDLTNAGYSSDPDVVSIYPRQYSLALASSGPDANSSQFFIILSSDPAVHGEIAGRHTVFAGVISGRVVIEALNSVELAEATAEFPRPEEDVEILAIEIIEV